MSPAMKLDNGEWVPAPENPGAIFRMYARDPVASRAVLQAGLDEAGLRIDALAADRDALAAAIEESTAEMRETSESLVATTAVLRKVNDLVETLEAKNASLAADLETTKRALAEARRYTVHRPPCPRFFSVAPPSCTCGLDDIFDDALASVVAVTGNET